MSGLADICIAVLAGAAVSAGCALALRILNAGLIRKLRRVHPELRAGALMGVLAAPLGLGSFAALMIAFSTHGTAFDLVPHHCHVSAAGCVAHAPAAPSVALLALGSGLIAVIVLWMLFSVVEFCLRTAEAVRLLNAASVAESGSSVRILHTNAIVALASGIFRPRLFLSRGLCERLGADEREIVMAHEEAHGQRRDNLVRFIGSLFAIGHLPRTARRLCAELALAQEQACDRIAARRHGAVRAAETLLKVERLRGPSASDACFGAAFVDAPIAARVRALIAPDFLPAGQSRLTIALVAAACLGGILLGSEPLHHEIETVFTLLQD